MTISLGQSATPANTRIYAIGDVHGHLSLLESMHKKITADLNSAPIANYKIVFIGDYIDRGPDSAGCVQFLIELMSQDDNVVCLKGNHEQRLEDFIANPIDKAHSFFTFGGTESVMSYGVDMQSFSQTDENVLAAHAQLEQNLSAEHKQFYATRPRSVAFGDYLFAHAGVRPGISLKEQSDEDLINIRHEFLSHTGLYEKVVVHGHTPAHPMEIFPNRVNVDTWAYDTGVLSCLVLEDLDYRVIEASH